MLQNHIADSRAALTDPLFAIPPVPEGGPVPGIRWLRLNVARFADGAPHSRRRMLVTDLLADVDPAVVRELAAERTRAVFDEAHGRPVDVMAQVARVIPVDVLVTALGLPPVPAGAVAAVAKAYQPSGAEEEPADQAVAQLVTAFGGEADEATAARIGVLVQAYDATAGLIGNAVLAMLRAEHAGGIVAETLRQDPPVRATRRLATGTVITVDLAASGYPFGAGPHECPGREHAVAIAEGVVESVRGYRLVEPGEIEYESSAVLRIPSRLVVTR